MPPKKTLNHVPARTALLLTGSAIALAGYIGASSNIIGHDGQRTRQAGLATTLATSLAAHYQAQASSITNASISARQTGLETANPGGPATIALAAYGTTGRAPRPGPHGHHHLEHHKKRRRHHHRKHHHAHVRRHHHGPHHHGRHHRQRRHLGGAGGSPWRIAGSLMPAFHWTSRQFHYLNLLWMRESGWNRFARNPHSGAYGIPQALPGSRMASAGPNWRTSARTQIIWGMGYILGRYGTPRRAWEHELRYGWY